MINSEQKQNQGNVDGEKTKALLMLLDGAVRYTRYAISGMENKDERAIGENISKVVSILTQLDCALDKKIGGEMAENLSALYKYMMNRLTYANVNDDIEGLKEVEKLIIDLKTGFHGAAQKTLNIEPVKNENAKQELNKPQENRGLRIEL